MRGPLGSRFPDQHVPVAVICNVSTAQPGQYAHQLADLYLSSSIKAPTQPKTITLSEADLRSRSGMYRDTTTGDAVSITLENGQVRLQNAALLPLPPLASY